jgi:hypothetical protein
MKFSALKTSSPRSVKQALQCNPTAMLEYNRRSSKEFIDLVLRANRISEMTQGHLI